MYDSIRPGRVANDPTVVDIHALKYNPEGTKEFKLSFEDDFRLLPRRPRAIQMVTEPPPLYNSPQKIPHSSFSTCKSSRISYRRIVIISTTGWTMRNKTMQCNS
ncbi:hypothetical protein C0J52_07050 [Blattella germanica]|nr:hypothetical protein C0J52_07050 [Blattella germanica]